MNKALLVIAFVMTIMYIGKKRQHTRLEAQVKETKRICDSLQSELFVAGVQLNRYEMTLELMRETDSTCSLLFEELMTQETE